MRIRKAAHRNSAYARTQEVSMTHGARVLVPMGLLGLLACGGSTTSSGGGGSGAAGSSGSAGFGGSAGASGAGGQAGAAGHAGGTGVCTQDCIVGRTCCSGSCVDEYNDPHNCGACGKACADGTYCTSGLCQKIPCTGGCSDGTCCGAECCTGGQLCCDAAGPVDNGPHCVAPSDAGTCPVGCAPQCVCAAPDTPIATPTGERALGSLRVGDLVYSVESDQIVVVPILKLRRTSVRDHHVRRVSLANGVVLEISAAHPTADGRTFGELHAGSELGGVHVLAVEKAAYEYPATYDILPASSSGAYFAGGALIGSTLSRSFDTDLSACSGDP